MLPVEKIKDLLEEYMKSEDRIKNLELADPLTVFYVKKSQLSQIDGKIKERLINIEHLQGNSTEPK